ncbi:transferase [Leptospira bouyouniensis]|uniref:transferase n=1 Tax=Leptospira bouyouniensis TaxID=2484911 RepID=UPI0010917747|nr:transferase [Leptospira bouyouniensis]TGM79453.1 transferase [Leptospira bouyouniensis]
MYLLFPGRHHLLTRYQKEYLLQLVKHGLSEVLDVFGNPLAVSKSPTAIIFAVTSANHNNTRRNPLPLYQRAMMIQDFSRELSLPSYVIPIDDIGLSPNFASYTIKKIEVETELMLSLTPENTIVLCSTPVANLYLSLGYRILPVEKNPGSKLSFHAKLPWEELEEIVSKAKEYKNNQKQSNLERESKCLDSDISFDHLEGLLQNLDPACIRLWKDYRLFEKVDMLFSDSLIGDDGDLTESRDYNTYVREMDNIAELKFEETKPFVKPGRIGDIGCAVGSWIKLVCQESNYSESDFYGVEIARHLYQLCEQRKENGEFSNPNIFFIRRNAVSGNVFPKMSMNTIHTSSLTHEIESYGGRSQLLAFLQNRYEELVYGGVWINRDVLGPEDKEKEVFVWMEENSSTNHGRSPKDFPNFKEYLDSLSTKERFFQFQRDFRKEEGYVLRTASISVDGIEYERMKLKDICEYISKKDYTDNWESEMHESFCFWSFREWKENLESIGFKISPNSNQYRNEWLVQNRYEGKVKLFSSQSENPNNGSELIPLDFPVTHMLMLAEK